MNKRNVNVLAKLLLVVMMLGVLSPAIAQAADTTDARIEKLEAAVRALQAELNALKAERAAEKRKPPAVDQKYVDSMVSKAIKSKKGEITGVPDWLGNITPFGDLRLRYEYMDDETKTDARNRNRVRARFGFKAKFNDEWDATVRLATGNSDGATSTNQTLGDDSDSDSFGKKKVWIDLVYTDWHPTGIEGLNLYGGKMKNPFYRVGKNQVIWDSDVNPEGGAVSYKYALDSATTANFTGGGFWIRENANMDDVSLMGLQGSVKHKFDDGTHVLFGGSYYDYGNLEGTDTDTALDIDLKGNTGEGFVYKYDYDIAEAFAEYGFKYAGMPVTLFGNYVENTAAAQNNNAYSIGFVLNKAKKPRSWQFGYYYRDVEPDAVVGGLSDSDFIDGGTNGRGHVFGYKYQWTKNIQSAVTYFDNDKGHNRDDFKRLQLDLIFKF
jgi:type II secretory pathway pseudopilin PulG